MEKKKTHLIVTILLILVLAIVLYLIIARHFSPKTKIECDYNDGPIIYGVEVGSDNKLKAGTYSAHVDYAMTFKGETQAHAPGIYDIWIIDHAIDSTGELLYIEPNYTVGGMGNDYVDITLNKGDYVVIRPYEVSYYPSGQFVMKLIK